MNSTVTPQPLYQISPRPRIGALSVEVVSYILLGLGGVLPVVLLLGVALFLHCYRRHKNAQLDRWKVHLRQNRSLANGGRSNEATRHKTPSDLDTLSLSLHDSDLGTDPYFVGLNHAANFDDTVDCPADLKRSVTNSNVYFKDSKENRGKKSRAEIDSGIADFEPSSSLTNHQSSKTGHRIQQTVGHKTFADSSQRSRELRPQEDVGRPRVNGYPPGVIMGVNRLMENAKNSTGRSQQSNNMVSNITPASGATTDRKRAPSPPLIKPEPKYSTSNSKSQTAVGAQKIGEDKRQDLRHEEEQVLRYFDEIHSSLSFELDNVSQDQKAISFRRNSNFYTTRL